MDTREDFGTKEAIGTKKKDSTPKKVSTCKEPSVSHSKSVSKKGVNDKEDKSAYGNKQKKMIAAWNMSGYR
ncbi:hypothetical protein L1987_06187 [Smallanthus sonchifolius]|uniref:Uncharacterized protein n=1 Tax=Smallanthus sonchifolius TaxID=185202 RepID=A0ACB9JXK1_9ASTR|nr:hypothetical protein L1987_06187 [Smallanthus sonchifolius]